MAKKDDAGESPGLSDEEWAEFEKQFTAEATKTAAYKEPSARQRELTAKWKKEAPKDTGWRTDGPRLDTSVFSRPTAPVIPLRKRRRRWVRNVAWVLLAATVTGALIGLPKLFSSSGTPTGSVTPHVPFGGTIPGATPSASAPGGAAGGAAPSATAPAATTYANPDDQYFEGSPSIDWANGAAGIVPPPAAKVGNYSAKTVGDAYSALQKMLVIVDIDPQVLSGAEPTALFAMLDPKEGLRADYESSTAKPSRRDDPVAFATRFDPKRVQVLGKTVKVHGSMSAAVNSKGELIVTADYSFVYALQRADGSGYPDRSLVRRTWQLDIPPWDPAPKPGRYWLYDYAYDVANNRCDLTDGWINPSFGAASGATGPGIDPYETTPPPVDRPTPTAPVTPTPAQSSAVDCQAVKRI